ncbi:MAG: glucose-1-phosphate adenylyltransferase subunit GlgD [Clostridia bacterium]|nr:glucose-1-phosphate adenylyltransferase subunit GlgD [Clostridia bacterium]
MDAFCILFTDTYDSKENKLNELSGKRTLASIPFGARFRLIDFMLSSLVGASVHNIGIITKSKYGSLMDHLGWGKDWDLDRKNGGLKILTPFATTDFSYNDNQFEILKSVHGYIDSMLPEYCVVANANMVANINFNEMFARHIESGADISVLCTKRLPTDSDTELTLDEASKVTKAIIHTTSKNEETYIAEDVFIMEKSLLYALIDHGVSYGWRTFKKDVIAKKFAELNINAYEHKGYFKIIDSPEVYLSANLDMLNREIRQDIFRTSQPILTRTKDSVPTKYGDNAHVSNCYVADGCVIDGEIENSIIFRNVKIAKGAKISNSVIMQNSVIEKDASLECVIIDKNVKISENKEIRGVKTLPVVVNKGKTV